MKPRRLEQAILLVQGAYFLGTGLWPLLHYESFERISGREVDDWLVKAFAALLPVGGSLISAPGITLPKSAYWALAVPPLALAAIDLRYALAGRVSKVYLLDAAVELGLLAGHVAVWTLVRTPVRSRPENVDHSRSSRCTAFSTSSIPNGFAIKASAPRA